MMKRRTRAPLALTAVALPAVALLAAGCATPTPDARANTPAPATALVASDTLGGVLFTNTVAMGPRKQNTTPTFAEVPTR